MASVGRYLPGLGNPMDMTLPELDLWCESLAEVLSREYGSGDEGGSSHRAKVEEDMKRIHG